ncbi:MAG: GapR family DNA-binding domain-containing protein [Flavobacterium sp.]
MNIEKRLEVYGVIDKETGEVVIDRHREKKDIIDSGVRLLHEIETLKEDIKEILEDGKSRGYDKKNLKALMDNVFKSEIDEKIEELEQLRTEIENLYEGGEND